jgi:hypothetical protein
MYSKFLITLLCLTTYAASNLYGISHTHKDQVTSFELMQELTAIANNNPLTIVVVKKVKKNANIDDFVWMLDNIAMRSSVIHACPFVLERRPCPKNNHGKLVPVKFHLVTFRDTSDNLYSNPNVFLLKEGKLVACFKIEDLSSYKNERTILDTIEKEFHKTLNAHDISDEN